MSTTRSTLRGAIAGVTALAALIALAIPAGAQQTGIVRGTVTDSTARSPIAGVQVVVTGSAHGTVTNADGQYVIRDIPAGPITLSAQRIGFAPSQRHITVVAGQTVVVDFAINPVAAILSEVVSVGYGTSSRHEVSSAIASVDSTAISNQPVAGVDNALQGKVAGVQVMQNSGEPGGGVSIRVRGPASLNAGNQPLYVVDGVPIISSTLSQTSPSGQSLTAVTGLNPDEIASIDVLKDAAAAAIYGSRGSNGVVLITTKRGAINHTQFSLNAYTGTQTREHRLEALNATQFVTLLNDAATNDGKPAPYVLGVADANNYDWVNAIYRNAAVSDVDLSVSGGADRFRYYGSVGNFNQEGIIIGSAYQRQSGRFNIDFNATPKLLLTTSLGLTRELDDRVPGDGNLDGLVTKSLSLQPINPFYGNSSGFSNASDGLNYSNPLATAAFSFNHYTTMRALGNAQLVYHVTDGLTLNGRAGADVVSLDELAWQSPKVDKTTAASVNGIGQSDHTTATKYVLEGFIGDEAIRTSTQTLSVTAGSSVEYNHTDQNAITGQGFPTGFTTYVRNASTISSWNGDASDNNLVSFFSRANYSLRDRYLLSASFRADGSSRFGTSNRFGYFPAISAGWVLTDESFAHSLERFATIKLRGSFGETGNQGIGDYARLTLATGAPYSGAAGVAGSQLGNPDLKWESTKESDAGVDASTLGGRIGIIADYYRRNTDNLLVQLPIPSTSGYSSIWNNIGAIRNTGVDLGLHTLNVETAHFTWNSDLNVTWNQNKVTALYGGQPVTFTEANRVVSIAAVGQPLGEFYLYKFLRVDPATGNAVYASANGGETLKPTSSDLTYVGNPQPKYFGGFTNVLSYRSFDLRGFLQFSEGNKVFDMVRIFTDDGGATTNSKNIHELTAWQKPGDITDEPRWSATGSSGANVISSRFVEDGSFVRLGEVTLGYALPASIGSRAHLSNARLYVSGRNLATWTRYSGYNPDVNSAGPGSNVVMGVDYYAYPLARTYSVGITASW
ncbi:MAG TPA: SusC/RagA family TonB-linked outer membrane protein [Gemmatimonadaceae bacterium]|jgi:TonB-linked SusC/RagA family outer membrane protein